MHASSPLFNVGLGGRTSPTSELPMGLAKSCLKAPSQWRFSRLPKPASFPSFPWVVILRALFHKPYAYTVSFLGMQSGVHTSPGHVVNRKMSSNEMNPHMFSAPDSSSVSEGRSTESRLQQILKEHHNSLLHLPLYSFYLKIIFIS